jgi:hypothetical protein
MVDQIRLIFPDLLKGNLVRGSAIMLGKFGEVTDISSLRVDGEIPDL